MACDWTHDTKGTNYWKTSCGSGYWTYKDTPQNSGILFCPKCGDRIRITVESEEKLEPIEVSVKYRGFITAKRSVLLPEESANTLIYVIDSYIDSSLTVYNGRALMPSGMKVNG